MEHLNYIRSDMENNAYFQLKLYALSTTICIGHIFCIIAYNWFKILRQEWHALKWDVQKIHLHTRNILGMLFKKQLFPIIPCEHKEKHFPHYYILRKHFVLYIFLCFHHFYDSFQFKLTWEVMRHMRWKCSSQFTIREILLSVYMFMYRTHVLCLLYILAKSGFMYF